MEAPSRPAGSAGSAAAAPVATTASRGRLRRHRAAKVRRQLWLRTRWQWLQDDGGGGAAWHSLEEQEVHDIENVFAADWGAIAESEAQELIIDDCLSECSGQKVALLHARDLTETPIHAWRRAARPGPGGGAQPG